MLTTTVIFVICMVIVLATLAEEVLLIWLFRPFTPSGDSETPYVSILVAMRDEENNARRCLDALLKQDYPHDRLEILIGNDESADATWEILREYAAHFPVIQVYNIESRLGIARGKANVIAHLAKKAKGDIFLITDADVECNRNWCRTMVTGLKPETGLANGFSMVRGRGFQHLEWIQAQGMLHVLQQMTTVTAIGNNMLVTREAYEATGGFENIPLSVTEDFALTRAVRACGYRLESRLCSDTRGETIPMTDFSSLISQRKRWMQGAMRVPLKIFLLLIVRALYFPGLLVVAWMEPLTATGLFLLRYVLQIWFILKVNDQTMNPVRWNRLAFFEFYMMFMTWAEIIAFLWPGKVNWKGREFS